MSECHPLRVRDSTRIRVISDDARSSCVAPLSISPHVRRDFRHRRSICVRRRRFTECTSSRVRSLADGPCPACSPAEH